MRLGASIAVLLMLLPGILAPAAAAGLPYLGALLSTPLKHPYFLVTSNATSVGPGWTPVRLNITNIGGTAYGVEVWPGVAQNLEVRASVERVGVVKGNSSFAYVFYARAVAPGQAGFTVVIKFYDPVDGVYKAEKVPIVLVSRPAAAKLAAMQVGVLRPGEKYVVIRVYNLGNAEARCVNVSLVSWMGLVTHGLTVSLGDIPAGGEKDFTIPVEGVAIESPAQQPVLVLQAVYIDADGSRRVMPLQVRVSLEPLAPIITYTAEPVYLLPGTCKTVDILLRNTGSGDAYNLTVAFTVQPPLILKEASPTFIPLLPAGGFARLRLLVCTPTTTMSTASMIGIGLSYSNVYGVHGAYTLRVPVSIGEAYARVRAYFTPSNVSLSEGECRSLELHIVNEGVTEIHIASVTIQPLQLIAVSYSQPGGALLEPGHSITVPVKVCAASRIAAPMAATLAAAVAYRGGAGGGGQAAAAAMVDLRPRPMPVISVTCSPSIIQPGEATVYVNVSSDVLLEEMHVRVTFQQIGASFEKYFTDTRRGVVVAKLVVPVQLDGANLASMVTIDYVDRWGRRGASTGACTVVVGGRPSIEPVSTTVAPAVAKPGDVVAISVLAANRGTGSAFDLVATLLPPKGFSVIGEKSIYIGRLLKSATTVLSYTLQVPEHVAPGTYTAVIHIKYHDSLMREHSVEIKVPIKVSTGASTETAAPSSPAQGGGGVVIGAGRVSVPPLTLAAIIVGVGLAALFIVYFMRMSRGGGSRA
ncbi:MAG: hypothetical protein GXO09_06270 [Crenarchaeota archaeon]|nr:hypothetical protein [Thermoproteota archaeon]